MGQTILILDDEQPIRKMLSIALKSSGYQTMEASNIKEATMKSMANTLDMILLDLGLPDGDGLKFLELFRLSSNAPVIVISAVCHEDKKVLAFECGADDYLTKPFGTSELLARIKAALRRYEGVPTSNVLGCGELMLNLTNRLVTMSDIEIKLTPKEYELLKIMMQNSGKVLTHNWLLKEVWGVGYQNEIHYLRVFINQLRQKIEIDPSRPKIIQTETGIGYRMVC